MSELEQRLRRLGDRAATRLRRVVGDLPHAGAGQLPRVRLDLGHDVPCWLLRAVAAAVAVATGALVVESGFTWFLLLGVAVIIMLFPGGWAGSLLFLLLAPVLLFAAVPVSGLTLAALIAGTHVVSLLCGLLGLTAWSARVELACLLLPLPRFAAVQVVAQVVAVVGALAAGLPPGLPWLAPAVALSLLVGVHWLLPRLAVERQHTFSTRQQGHDFLGESVVGPGGHRDA